MAAITISTNTMTGRETIEKAQQENMSFLTDADVKAIAEDPETRLTLVLVRCGGGRFLAPADQAGHFIALIEEHNACPVTERSDYIRDVSLPVNVEIRGDAPRHETIKEIADSIKRKDSHIRQNVAERLDRQRRGMSPVEDYGGAFDGTNVSSDADGGL